MEMMPIIRERLLNKCEIATKDECWIWTGAKSTQGYGLLRVDGKLRKSHRLSHIEFIGPIPKGMMICHKCDVPACINPGHLYAGTAKDNMQDRKQRTGYSQSADLSGENNGNSKLSESEVIAIRNATGYQKHIAVQFGVNQSTVCRIKSGKRWCCAASPR
jgi:hypothetical protein